MVKHLYKQLEHQLAKKKSGNIQLFKRSICLKGWTGPVPSSPFNCWKKIESDTTRNLKQCMKNAKLSLGSYLYSIWLVVDPPLWKKIVSQLGWWLPIYGKIKNDPNHQPGMVITALKYTSKGSTFSTTLVIHSDCKMIINYQSKIHLPHIKIFAY